MSGVRQRMFYEINVGKHNDKHIKRAEEATKLLEEQAVQGVYSSLTKDLRAVMANLSVISMLQTAWCGPHARVSPPLV